jgi:hypothetical protein
VIDLGQTQKTKAFVDRQLRRFGVGSINDAISALAKTIRDHKHLETFLTSIDSLGDRQEVYDSIRPHLRFEPWPLDRYNASANRMAEREQLPILGEDGHLHPFRPAQDVRSQAQETLDKYLAEKSLTLTCYKCLAEESFYALNDETKVDVTIRARRAGWIYDIANDKEICPKCPAYRPN